jgi:hypothetical protein
VRGAREEKEGGAAKLKEKKGEEKRTGEGKEEKEGKETGMKSKRDAMAEDMQGSELGPASR